MIPRAKVFIIFRQKLLFLKIKSNANIQEWLKAKIWDYVDTVKYVTHIF